MTNDRPEFLFDVGDLVELARFGFAPKEESDRVFGLVVGLVNPIDYYVPRYKVRINYKPEQNQSCLDDFIVSRNQRVITVMEYDIIPPYAAGDKEGTQD